MALTAKIVSQQERLWGWESWLGIYDGKTLVETRLVSGQPDSYRLNELAQKVQDNIDNPIIPEKLYTQTEVDKIVIDAIKEATGGQ